MRVTRFAAVSVAAVLLCPAAAYAATSPAVPAEPATAVAIHDIQGSGHVSPMAGETVSGVPGVVTAVRDTGFWMQATNPDRDPATSEGIFVYEREASVEAGKAVAVTGRVQEHRPGGEGTNLTTTEIIPDTVTVTSRAATPAATLVGPGGRTPPRRVIDNDANGDVEKSGAFQPRQDGLDFYESLEGMRLEMHDAVATAPTNGFGEIPVLAAHGSAASVRSARGGIILRQQDANPERLIVDDTLAATPDVKVGDVLTGSIIGVLGYSFGNFKLQVTSMPSVRRNPLPREVTEPAGARELSVATFNVENLDPGDPRRKFDRLAGVIVDHLRSPDILTVEEIQDNSGPTNDGAVEADKTVGMLIDAITSAGGPVYKWRGIAPVNNQNGGQPGGNIRVGFLFRTDRGLRFVDRPGADATSATHVTERDGDPTLTYSPGHIDPANPAFEDSRKPLAGEFRWRGRRLFVIANHWNSKGGDQPLFGRYQPPERSSEAQRVAQARVVADFVDEIQAADPRARVIVAGDLNDFPWSDAVRELTATGLRDLPAKLPARERYTYVYQGNSQVLDHILLSRSLTRGRHEYDIVHVNSEYRDPVSDHDPQVVRLRLR